MAKLNFINSIKNLPPVCFAVPMSTGIISIGSSFLGYKETSNVFFLINNIEMMILTSLLLLRVVFFGGEIKKDLSFADKGAGFFTFVIALCIFGTKNILLRNNLTLAIAGWCTTFIIWLALCFAFFILVTKNKERFSLKEALNGTWLLLVVSVQALSISGNSVASHFNFRPQITLCVALIFLLLGAILYLMIIVLILYRFVFLPFEPKDFHPSYWINMGAVAISTLAGSVMVKSIEHANTFVVLLPMLKILTVAFWIVGTCWIPVIVYFEIRKRVKIKVEYFIGYWSLVFPIGVYTACTWYLSVVMDSSLLAKISQVTIWIAWLAWGITYLQMVGKIRKKIIKEEF